MKLKLLASAIGCLVAVAAHADVVTYSDNTTGAPTYSHVSVDSGGVPSAPDPTINATSYKTFTFTATDGDYSFSTVGTFDTFAALYSGTVTSPSGAPLIANNGLLTSGIGTAGFSRHLDAGTYTYVTSAFASGAGFFTTSINNGGGSGTITPAAGLPSAAPSPRVTTITGTNAGNTSAPRVDVAFDADGNPETNPDGSFVLVPSADSIAYKTFSFSAGATGGYSFVANGDYDTFLSLYSGTYDPSDPLANLVTFNDDAVSGVDGDGNFEFVHFVSSLTADLVAGRNYVLVTTGFDSESIGSFVDSILAPAAVGAPIPEPETLALLVAGLVMAGLAARRRKA